MGQYIEYTPSNLKEILMHLTLLILLSFLFLANPLTAGNAFSALSFSELELTNGMKVILKQLPDEDEDIEVSLIAPGGWAGLSKIEKTNARIATEVLWESGFSAFSSDKTHALMWLNSVELQSEIKPFSRTIDGMAPSEGVEMLFKLINGMLTSPSFTEKGLDEAKRKVSETLKLLPYDSSHIFDYFSKAQNTGHYKGFRQLNVNSLKRKTDLEMVKQVYERCFGNPADFKVFITGHFDKDEMIALLKKYFESIPAKQGAAPFEMSTKEMGTPHFPQGIARLELPTFQLGTNESIIKMTFSVDGKVDKNHFKKIFLLSKLIDRRLNNEFEKTGVIGEGYCFCQYCFPFYPYLNGTWMTIQSRSGSMGTFKDPHQIEKSILAVLQNLQQKGPTDDELLFLNHLIRDRDLSFSENDDLLKLFLLDDEILKTISKEIARVGQRSDHIITRDETIQVFNELINLNNYTVIFSKK